MTKPWKEKALSVMQNYLNEQDLPSGSTINDIERKLWNSQPALFKEILQIRANSESLSWPYSQYQEFKAVISRNSRAKLQA